MVSAVQSQAQTQTQTQTQTAAPSSSTSHILKLRAAVEEDRREDTTSSRLREPIELSNLFQDRYGKDIFDDLTPAIGTEFRKPGSSNDGRQGGLDLAAILQREEDGSQPIDQELWTQLAALVSHRGVVFFRGQNNLTPLLMNRLSSRISHFSGKPNASGMHIHPLSKEFSESGQFIGGEVIDSKPDAEGRQISFPSERSNFASAGWHTDISFEPIPSDYAMLQLRVIPKTGGDTLWSSMYSAYDALSPHMQQFLEGLTAVHDAEEFREQSAKYGFPLYTKARGHPENVGNNLRAVHPVIRTNPVTGYKGLYVNKSFTKRINELSIDESDMILAYLFRHIAENFNYQVRFKWRAHDLAIWDNRSTNHSGIFDFGNQRRTGDRACSLGEKPYFNAIESRSRKETIEQQDREAEAN